MSLVKLQNGGVGTKKFAFGLHNYLWRTETLIPFSTLITIHKKKFATTTNYPWARPQASTPTTNGGVQRKSPVGTCAHRTHVFARLATTCNAQSVLIDKVSASEPSREFSKSFVVGWGGMHSRVCTHLLQTSFPFPPPPSPSTR